MATMFDKYFEGCLVDPTIVKSVNSTSKEREDLGSLLLEVSLDWKRILSPMLTYEVTQEALVLVFRETSEEISIRSLLTTTLKAKFNKLLESMKSMPEKDRFKLKQRHEKWIDTLRDQVDVTGDTGVKRIINEEELDEIMKLGEQMKATGNTSFGSQDYHMASVRYLQAIELVKNISTMKPNRNQQIEDFRKICHRNLSLSSLKQWEWSRSIRSCDAVLELNPQDLIVRLRRAEALGSVGKFDKALEDINFVLTSSSSSSSPSSLMSSNDDSSNLPSDKEKKDSITLPDAVDEKALKVIISKARKLSSLLRAQLSKSDNELKKAMSKGLSNGTFSSDRNQRINHHLSDTKLTNEAPSLLSSEEEKNDGVHTKKHVSETRESKDGKEDWVNESPHQRHLRGKWEAEKAQKEAQLKLTVQADQQLTQNTTKSATKSNSATNKSSSPKDNVKTISPSKKRLDIDSVHKIQAEQITLFSSKSVQSKLNEIRIAADFEEQRFLYRVRSFKVQVQESLLLEYGFDVTLDGLAQFERAIAAHMVDDKQIGANMKAIAKSIMGVVWEEDA